jgi:hypothetical protein
MSRPLQSTLFGGVELARAAKTATVAAQGYAAAPGTGPTGESCATCEHCCLQEGQRRSWYKCRLMRGAWTSSRTTDILVSSPACARWEAAEFPRTKGARKQRNRKPKARKSLPERLE